jgi:hypothetical protein
MTLKKLNWFLKTPSDIRPKGPSLMDYPRELRGPPNNRYGGHRALRIRGFRGNTYGPAGPVRRFTREEIREYEQTALKKNRELELKNRLKSPAHWRIR